jgi:hypothetical protein
MGVSAIPSCHKSPVESYQPLHKPTGMGTGPLLLK